jgi:hypothetical protein
LSEPTLIQPITPRKQIGLDGLMQGIYVKYIFLYIEQILETYKMFARRKKFREQAKLDNRVINPVFGTRCARNRYLWKITKNGTMVQ